MDGVTLLAFVAGIDLGIGQDIPGGIQALGGEGTLGGIGDDADLLAGSVEIGCQRSMGLNERGKVADLPVVREGPEDSIDLGIVNHGPERAAGNGIARGAVIGPLAVAITESASGDEVLGALDLELIEHHR